MNKAIYQTKAKTKTNTKPKKISQERVMKKKNGEMIDQR